MSRVSSRRMFLATSFAAAAGSALLPSRSLGSASVFLQQMATPNPSSSPATTINATTRTLDINGKAAKVLGLLQPDGTQGMEAVVGRDFRVTLDNKLTVPTAIHWHGLHPPNNEDGVPGVTQLPLTPNSSDFYNFPVQPAGTHWMHSHQGLQEAFLLAAPMIVHDPADEKRSEQEIVVMLSDFSFTPPKEVFANLRKQSKGSMGSGTGQPAAMPAAKTAMNMMPDKPDANDVNYDAYLANDRTLNDPEVVKVEKGGRVRLRIINGSSGTNFFIDLGSLTGELIATDGMPVKPIRRQSLSGGYRAAHRPESSEFRHREAPFPSWPCASLPPSRLESSWRLLVRPSRSFRRRVPLQPVCSRWNKNANWWRSIL